MADERKITSDELYQMFGGNIPIEAVAMVFNSGDEDAASELRKALRRVSREYRISTGVET